MAGPCLIELFPGNQSKKIWFFQNNQKNSINAKNINNISEDKNGKTITQKNEIKPSDKRNFINRNLIFFCSAMNRHAGFFGNYPILQKNNWEYVKKITEIIVDGKSLSKPKRFMCQNFIETIVQKLKQINYDKLIGIYCFFDKEKFKTMTAQTKYILNNKIMKENDKGFLIICHIKHYKLLEIENIFGNLYEMDVSYDNVFNFLKAVISKVFDTKIIGIENYKELISSFLNIY